MTVVDRCQLVLAHVIVSVALLLVECLSSWLAHDRVKWFWAWCATVPCCRLLGLFLISWVAGSPKWVLLHSALIEDMQRQNANVFTTPASQNEAKRYNGVLTPSRHEWRCCCTAALSFWYCPNYPAPRHPSPPAVMASSLTRFPLCCRSGLEKANGR